MKEIGKNGLTTATRRTRREPGKSNFIFVFLIFAVLAVPAVVNAF